MADETLELSIVMPCLNEAETVGTCVEKAKAFLQTHRVTGEVIVADNGSTDGSQAIASQCGARVVSAAVRGYGSALMDGFTAARGTYLVMGDADGNFDFTQLEPFLTKLREGYDLVMGNRFQGGVKPGAMRFLNRYLGNPVLTALGRLFFHSPIGDFQCGLRGFRKTMLQELDLRTTGMEFASEMVVKATLLGKRITEVPAIMFPAGRRRPPHLRRWRDGWRHLRFLLLYSPSWLFLYPGGALIFLGLSVGVWLLPGPRRVGSFMFDMNTLILAAVVTLIGFQGVSFAAFTRVFAFSEGLLPESPLLARLFRIVTLEVGLILGGVCAVAGLTGSVSILIGWVPSLLGFRDTTMTLRLLIPAVVLLTLGCQIVLASFFLSVLGLRRK